MSTTRKHICHLHTHIITHTCMSITASSELGDIPTHPPTHPIGSPPTASTPSGSALPTTRSSHGGDSAPASEFQQGLTTAMQSMDLSDRGSVSARSSVMDSSRRKSARDRLTQLQAFYGTDAVQGRCLWGCVCGGVCGDVYVVRRSKLHNVHTIVLHTHPRLPTLLYYTPNTNTPTPTIQPSVLWKSVVRLLHQNTPSPPMPLPTLKTSTPQTHTPRLLPMSSQSQSNMPGCTITITCVLEIVPQCTR